MKRRVVAGAAVAVTLAWATGLQSATDPVTLVISPVIEIGVSGAPSLHISAGVAGAQPEPAVDSTATYSVSTNQSGRQVSVSLASAMPPGTTLAVRLAAPAGGASTGDIALSMAPATAVTAISPGAHPSLEVRYTFTATVAAGVLAPFTRSVTFTIQ